MKGKSRNKEEKRFHDHMASLGCVACRQMGMYTPHVSIHHIDGRTKAHAHYYVLPLCASHHQDMGNGIPSVHPYKSRFEAEYGSQHELFKECVELLNKKGIEVPEMAMELVEKSTGLK